MEHIGNIGVDAGIIWFGDPCYVMGADASHGVKDWDEFCNKLFADKKSQELRYAKPLGDGIGICVHTAWGDGSYPVYAERDTDNRIISVTVRMD